MPPAATKPKYGKISKSYILTLPQPQGHVMSVKCEEPIDESIVKVWLLYHHPNFKYYTLFVSGTELRTNRWMVGQTDRQTDGRTIQLLDAPADLSGQGHKNLIEHLHVHQEMKIFQYPNIQKPLSEIWRIFSRWYARFWASY